MEKTPLELYETAYRYQYHENRIPEAITYYEKLINEFPDSNECGYAAIQIQKIKASDLAKKLKLNSKPSKGFLTFLIFFNIITLLLLTGTCYYFYNELKTDSLRDRLTANVLSKIHRKEYDKALQLLSELKILYKSDITPYELSADIYRKKGEYKQARAQYDIFFRLNPDREPSKNELDAMQKDETAQLKKQKSLSSSSKVSSIGENNISTSNKGFTSSVKSSVNKESNSNEKGLYLVDPDSISYF